MVKPNPIPEATVASKPSSITTDQKVATATPSVEKSKVDLIPEISTELETIQPAEIDGKTGQLMLTEKHLQLIKSQIAPTATKEEFEMFIMMARRTRLDPIMRQLYFIKYGQGDKAKVSYVTSIDGYRIIAGRSHNFAGIDEPRFEYDKTGKLTHCSVTVYKIIENIKCGFSAKVKFSEYTTNSNLWVSKPETMIMKVAEAHALRKAFPNDLSGIYTTEEMDQARASQPAPAEIPMITKRQFDKIKEIITQKEIPTDKVRELASVYKRPSLAKLTLKQAGHFISELEKLPDPELKEEEVVQEPTFADFVDNQYSAENDVDLNEVDAGIEKQIAEK